MFSRCKICKHPQKDKIENLIRLGARQSDIIKRFPELSQSSLSRHKLRHMLRAKPVKPNPTSKDPLLADIRRIDLITADLESRILTGGKLYDVAWALETCRRNLKRMVDLARSITKQASKVGDFADLFKVIDEQIRMNPEEWQRHKAAPPAESKDEAVAVNVKRIIDRLESISQAVETTLKNESGSLREVSLCTENLGRLLETKQGLRKILLKRSAPKKRRDLTPIVRPVVEKARAEYWRDKLDQ